jgi:hypothetical protein
VFPDLATNARLERKRSEAGGKAVSTDDDVARNGFPAGFSFCRRNPHLALEREEMPVVRRAFSRSPRRQDRLSAPRALRTIRAARHFTLKQLERASGVNSSTLSQAETGRLLLVEHQLRSLATALGVDVGVLLLSPEAVLQRLRHRSPRERESSEGFL